MTNNTNPYLLKEPNVYISFFTEEYQLRQILYGSNTDKLKLEVFGSNDIFVLYHGLVNQIQPNILFNTSTHIKVKAQFEGDPYKDGFNYFFKDHNCKNIYDDNYTYGNPLDSLKSIIKHNDEAGNQKYCVIYTKPIYKTKSKSNIFRKIIKWFNKI